MTKHSGRVNRECSLTTRARGLRDVAGVVMEAPDGRKYQYVFKLTFDCSNNQAEFDALVVGLEMVVELKTDIV